MFFKVFECSFINFVVFLLLFQFSVSQDEEMTTEASETPSKVICETCNCTEGDIDCRSRGVELMFELQDWEGLKDKNYTTVDLSQNPLTSITSIISSLPIQTLNLSNCQIRTFEDASFKYLTELVTLDLSWNKITTDSLSRRVFGGHISQDKRLVKFEKMRYLSLATNDIHSLPQNVFTCMLSLTTLDLSGNPLSFIDQVTMGAITDLLYLKELNLHSCQLDSLPEGLFRRQRRLQRLDLSDNKFLTVPAVLREATNLRYLDLGKNLIQRLESENPLKNLTKLRELHLNQNQKLSNISAGALGGLPELVSIHISQNPRLTFIDPDFLMYTEDDVEVWPTITELYLNNNNLSRIDSSLLNGWSQLKAVDVSGNPYWCDCRNQWLVDVLVPALPLQLSQNMICRQPLEMRGISFAQLYNASKTLFCAENQSSIETYVPDMALVLGIMIGIFVTFPLVLIVILSWRKGYFKRCRSKEYSEAYYEETDRL